MTVAETLPGRISRPQSKKCPISVGLASSRGKFREVSTSSLNRTIRRSMRILLMSAVLALLPACSWAGGIPMLDDFVSMLGTPLNGRVYRMDLDVTGDGTPEIFLGSAGGHAMTWVVYTFDSTSGKYRQVPVKVRSDAPADYDATQVVFNYESFYYSATQSLFSAFIRVAANQGGWRRYEVSSGRFNELAQPYDPQVEETNGALWRDRRPPLYSASLADLRTSTSPVWKDFRTNEVQPSLGRLTGVVTR
jgi:hypothetical protein